MKLLSLATSREGGVSRKIILGHLVPDGEIEALCGATYGPRSAGWSEFPGDKLCIKCFKRAASRHGIKS